MTDYDYPKVVAVACAICGETVHIGLELNIEGPNYKGGLMRMEFSSYPTVLAGCHHFYEREEEGKNTL